MSYANTTTRTSPNKSSSIETSPGARFEDDVPLRAKFPILRARFKALRDKPRDTVMDNDTKAKQGSAQAC